MEPTAQSIARTYPEDVYEDAWDRVLEYRQVQSYAADHPNMGSQAISTALDMPRGRIRPWVNGGSPESVKAIQTAIDHGWLDPDPDSETARDLIELLAHVLAGGSIAAEFPIVALTPGRRVQIGALQDAFVRVGLNSTVRHATADGRATEVVATDDGVALGRCLVAMGAPRGTKTQLDALPSVLDEVPQAVRESFATIYAQHRAVEHEGKATLAITENRPASYQDDLAALFRDVTGEAVTVGANGITIPEAAATRLDIGKWSAEETSVNT